MKCILTELVKDVPTWQLSTFKLAKNMAQQMVRLGLLSNGMTPNTALNFQEHFRLLLGIWALTD